MTENIQNEDIVQSKAVIEMLTVANDYCLFFESADKYSKKDVMDYFRRVAPLLYLKASLLPEVIPADDTFSERYVTEEQWEGIFRVLTELFGPDDLYHTLDHNNDIIQASLADNMADVYQDMKDFVMLFQKNHFYAKENAVAQCCLLFQSHWGSILLHALKALHQKEFGHEDQAEFPVDEYDWTE